MKILEREHPRASESVVCDYRKRISRREIWIPSFAQSCAVRGWGWSIGIAWHPPDMPCSSKIYFYSLYFFFLTHSESRRMAAGGGKSPSPFFLQRRYRVEFETEPEGGEDKTEKRSEAWKENNNIFISQSNVPSSFWKQFLSTFTLRRIFFSTLPWFPSCFTAALLLPRELSEAEEGKFEVFFSYFFLFLVSQCWGNCYFFASLFFPCFEFSLVFFGVRIPLIFSCKTNSPPTTRGQAMNGIKVSNYAMNEEISEMFYSHVRRSKRWGKGQDVLELLRIIASEQFKYSKTLHGDDHNRTTWSERKKKLTEMGETYEHEEINLKIIQNAENFSLELFQNSFRVVDELRLCVFQLKTKRRSKMTLRRSVTSSSSFSSV